MQPHFEEVCFETLRAQYAELLRLREYVKRLEKLHGAPSGSDAITDDIHGEKSRLGPRVVELFG